MFDVYGCVMVKADLSSLLYPYPLNKNFRSLKMKESSNVGGGNMEYIILSGSLKTLISLVNDFISEGWKPLGGVSSFRIGEHFQAMTKEGSGKNE